MKLCDIKKELLAFLPKIEEAFICEFGEKHRQEITKRISLTSIYLENSYYYEETYLYSHTSSYQEEEISKIKYQAHKERYQINSFKYQINIKIKAVIKKIFKIDITEEDFPDFFDEFYHLEGGLIDYFGANANMIFNDEFTPEEIKLLILQKQEEFLNKYHFTPSTENVELLRAAISLVRDRFFKHISKNTTFSREFIAFIEANFGTITEQVAPYEALCPIITSQFNECLGSFSIIPNMETQSFNEGKKHGLIFMPLAKILKTYSPDDALPCLIHELGHSICYNDQLTAQEIHNLKKGENYLHNQFNLFLELSNESRARKVTSKVLNKNYNNNNSSYDLVLPLIKPFLEKYYHIINELDLLTAPIECYFDIFGPEFKDLIVYIYYEYSKISFFSYKIINNYEKPITYTDKVQKDIQEIISDIDEYVKKYYNPKKRKKSKNTTN